MKHFLSRIVALREFSRITHNNKMKKNYGKNLASILSFALIITPVLSYAQVGIPCYDGQLL